MDENYLYELVGYVISSFYRFKALFLLDEAVKMPSEISKEVLKKCSQVSKALSELKKKNLVLCTNEKNTKGRLYIQTPQGKEVLKFIKENNL